MDPKPPTPPPTEDPPAARRRKGPRATGTISVEGRPEEVAAALFGAEADERVELHAIRGTPRWLDEVEELRRSGSAAFSKLAPRFRVFRERRGRLAFLDEWEGRVPTYTELKKEYGRGDYVVQPRVSRDTKGGGIGREVRLSIEDDDQSGVNGGGSEWQALAYRLLDRDEGRREQEDERTQMTMAEAMDELEKARKTLPAEQGNALQALALSPIGQALIAKLTGLSLPTGDGAAPAAKS